LTIAFPTMNDDFGDRDSLAHFSQFRLFKQLIITIKLY